LSGIGSSSGERQQQGVPHRFLPDREFCAARTARASPKAAGSIAVRRGRAVAGRAHGAGLTPAAGGLLSAVRRAVHGFGRIGRLDGTRMIVMYSAPNWAMILATISARSSRALTNF